MSASMESFKVVDMPAFKVVGREWRVKMGGPVNPIPGYWGQCFSDGTMARLDQQPGRIYPNAYIGWMGRYNMADQTFSYVVGVLAEAGATTPADLNVIDVPAAKFGVVTMTGTEPDIYMQARPNIEAQLKAHALAFDEQVACEMEWYDERFNPEAGPPLTIDYYAAVK